MINSNLKILIFRGDPRPLCLLFYLIVVVCVLLVLLLLALSLGLDPLAELKQDNRDDQGNDEDSHEDKHRQVDIEGLLGGLVEPGLDLVREDSEDQL